MVRVKVKGWARVRVKGWARVRGLVMVRGLHQFSYCELVFY
jgi:hypothetical protein